MPASQHVVTSLPPSRSFPKSSSSVCSSNSTLLSRGSCVIGQRMVEGSQLAMRRSSFFSLASGPLRHGKFQVHKANDIHSTTSVAARSSGLLHSRHLARSMSIPSASTRLDETLASFSALQTCARTSQSLVQGGSCELSRASPVSPSPRTRSHNRCPSCNGPAPPSCAFPHASASYHAAYPPLLCA